MTNRNKYNPRYPDYISQLEGLGRRSRVETIKKFIGPVPDDKDPIPAPLPPPVKFDNGLAAEVPPDKIEKQIAEVMMLAQLSLPSPVESSTNLDAQQPRSYTGTSAVSSNGIRMLRRALANVLRRGVVDPNEVAPSIEEALHPNVDFDQE